MQRRTALRLAAGTAACFAVDGIGPGPARAAAPPLPRAADPAEVGFDPERLSRVTAWLRAEVAEGTIPGAVVVVGRRGRVALLEAVGFRDRASGSPMTTDAVFPIASLTKPIVSLAAMVLVEEGRLQLQHPLGRYLPEMRDLRVGVERGGADGRAELALEPARREPTIQDLLRHTAGFTYGVFGDGAVKRLYREARVDRPDQTIEEFVAGLARLPLASQPGTTWDYSMGTALLGRIVELLHGADLHTALAERVARPLGMEDTGFFLGPDAAARAAQAQAAAQPGQAPEPPPFDPARRPRWFRGDGGMVSTAPDYARFLQTLLGGGRLGSARLVARKTVELMASDHLPPDVRHSVLPRTIDLVPLPEYGYGFGLGFAVRTAPGRSPMPGSVGDYYWVGSSGPSFWVDPREELYAVLMARAPNPVQVQQYRRQLRQLVYAAVE